MKNVDTYYGHKVGIITELSLLTRPGASVALMKRAFFPSSQVFVKMLSGASRSSSLVKREVGCGEELLLGGSMTL